MTIKTIDQLVTVLDKDGNFQHEYQSVAEATPHSAVSPNYHDSHIDTKAEARALQQRLSNFDNELKTLPPDSHRHRIVKLQRDSLARAIPLELARYRQLDAQRARTADMARAGLNKRGR